MQLKSIDKILDSLDTSLFRNENGADVSTDHSFDGVFDLKMDGAFVTQPFKAGDVLRHGIIRQMEPEQMHVLSA